MNEEAHQGLRELSKNKHGLSTIAGIVVCVLLALLSGKGLVFGLVMGAVYSSGLGIGKQVVAQIRLNAPQENMGAAMIAGPIAAAIVVGVITALILGAIQGAVDVAPMEGDDIIATIVKSFFDSAAALAVAAGVVVGGWVHGLASN